MEIWDVYNRDREKTGRTMIRGSTFKQGDCHLVVHICIFNAAGQMLIQQRQPFKHSWPNLWDVTVGGSALVGENTREAAQRELFEELGLKMDLSELRPQLTIHFQTGFDDYYLIQSEVNLEELTLQAEEVQQAKWASESEILKMIGDGVFIPFYENLIRLLFDMKDKLGAMSR